jgi:L-aspartate oxidase
LIAEFLCKDLLVAEKEGLIRRYLTNIDTTATSQLFTNVLVLGAGVAGLRAAIEASRHGNVILACKNGITDSNTWYAQGGIASVLDRSDSFESHIKDTLSAGGYINDTATVELVIRKRELAYVRRNPAGVWTLGRTAFASFKIPK